MSCEAIRERLAHSLQIPCTKKAREASVIGKKLFSKEPCERSPCERVQQLHGSCLGLIDALQIATEAALVELLQSVGVGIQVTGEVRGNGLAGEQTTE
jgi:hypothetical protein